MPLCLLPLVALGIFWRNHLWHRSSHADPGRSISASLRALLDENRLARSRVKVVSSLYGLMLVLLPLIVFQLRAVGKAGDEILVPAFVLFPALVIGLFIGITRYDRRRLQPRQRELEALLRSYE